MTEPRIGIFGATGEVGRELISLLDKFKDELPVQDISLYAGKSAGNQLDTYLGRKIVQSAEDADYSQLDLAFWAVGADWSRKEWEKAVNSYCFVVDNSSAFRYDSEIPLIVPEVNREVLEDSDSRLIANPNCTTAIAAIPLHVLDVMSGLKRVSFTTYQSASGAGNGGREELFEQTRNYLDGERVTNSVFQHPLPFNVIPHIDKFQDNGYTKEEMKTDWETRKILSLEDDVRISSTCVRVPVERSHAEDILVETEKPVDITLYREVLAATEGVAVFDTPGMNVYPMPIHTSGEYQVQVGRMRDPEIFENGIRMFVCGDQLLRGAALNAVLIGEELYGMGRFTK